MTQSRQSSQRTAYRFWLNVGDEDLIDVNTG